MNKKPLYIILGLLIFVFIFYNRLIRVRLPKELYIFPPYTSDIRWIFLIVSILWIIICIIIIYKSILLYLKKQENKTILTEYQDKFSQFIEESIKEGYQFLINFIGKYINLYDLFSVFASKYDKFMKFLPKSFILFLIYFIRIIITTCFLVDIFIFFEFNYFYKSLYFLIIPLIINIIHYILKDIAEENYNLYVDNLGIEDKGINNCGKQVYSYNIKEEYKNLANQINYFMNEFIICRDILAFLEGYESHASVYNIRKNLVVYTFFLIGWSFILIKNIYLIW